MCVHVWVCMSLCDSVYMCLYERAVCDSVHVIVWQCAYVTVCMSLCDSVYVWVCIVCDSVA